MSSASQQWTLKVELDGEVRRCRNWPASGTEASIEVLRSSICNVFDMDLAEKDALNIKYHDDEGDLCTLVEATLPDALQFASQQGVLKLTAALSKEGRACKAGDTAPVRQASTVLASALVPADGLESSEPVTEPVAESPSEPAVESQDEIRLESSEPITEPVAESPTEPAAESQQMSQEAGSFSGTEAAAEALESATEHLEEFSRNLSQHVNNVSQSIAARVQPHVSQIQHAAQEQVNEVQRAATEQATEMHRAAQEQARAAQEQATEARRAAQERFEVAGPRISEGFSHFKQKVCEDFHTTSNDMKDAFGPSQDQAVGAVRTVAGVAAGVLAAARFVPIRATRLAAHSVAAVARREMPDVETETVQEVQAATADDRGAVAEFSHLKQQVMRDFSTSRKEIGTAFACILSEKQDSTARAQTSTEDEQASTAEAESSQPCEHQRVKDVVPAVVSTGVGIFAAACLLPLRATRFAVANVANAATPAAANADQSSPQAESQSSEERQEGIAHEE